MESLSPDSLNPTASTPVLFLGFFGYVVQAHYILHVSKVLFDQQPGVLRRSNWGAKARQEPGVPSHRASDRFMIAYCVFLSEETTLRHPHAYMDKIHNCAYYVGMNLRKVRPITSRHTHPDNISYQGIHTTNV